MNNLFLKLIAASMLSIACYAVHAEQFTEFGPYRLHYVAFPSNELNTTVAQRMGIKRSAYKALAVLNLQIRDSDNQWIPAEFDGEVHVKNLIGQNKDTDLRTIRDAGVQYLIAETQVRHHETLTYRFNISTQQPDRSRQHSHQFSFKQKFWVE